MFFANNLRRQYQTWSINRNISSIFVRTPAPVFRFTATTTSHCPVVQALSYSARRCRTADCWLLLSSEASKKAATWHYTLCLTQDSAHALCVRVLSDLYISILGTQLIRQAGRMLVHDVQITLRGYFQLPQMGAKNKMARTVRNCWWQRRNRFPFTQT